MSKSITQRAPKPDYFATVIHHNLYYPETPTFTAAEDIYQQLQALTCQLNRISGRLYEDPDE